MKPALTALCCAILLLPASALADKGNEPPPEQVGILHCIVLPHSGINLLIHSTRDIRCTFTPDSGRPEEYYKGETGIGFGIDVSLDSSSSLDYSVLARHFSTAPDQLAGKYHGAGGRASLGVTLGETAPIGKDYGSILLQPMGGRNKGAGVNAGFTYLHLEPDRH